jgi:hypothetical protein
MSPICSIVPVPKQDPFAHDANDPSAREIEGRRAGLRVFHCPAPAVQTGMMIRTGRPVPAYPWFLTSFVPGKSQDGRASLNFPLPRNHTTTL